MFILTMVMSSTFTSKSTTYYNENSQMLVSTIRKYDEKTYGKELSYNDKLQVVLKKHGLDNNMYNVVSSIVASESKSGSYKDAYAVINVIYNRTISKRWNNHVSNVFGNNAGNNIYYQAIAPNQFTVYSSGSYMKYMNNTPKNVKEAMIDFLYSLDTMHNYLSFRSGNYKGADAVSFDEGGNKYFNEIAYDDLIS